MNSCYECEFLRFYLISGDMALTCNPTSHRRKKTIVNLFIMANCNISKKTFILWVDIANYLLRASEITIHIHESHFPFSCLLFMDLLSAKKDINIILHFVL